VISAEVQGIKFAESLKVSTGTYACLKIDERTLFKQAIVVWKFGGLKHFD
jgi:hypothetical protein